MQQGVQVKLIQSNDGFNLSNLYELRFFSDIINDNTDSPLITDEDWADAKRKLNAHINASAKRDLANTAIKAFEEANTAKKYKSRLESFHDSNPK